MSPSKVYLLRSIGGTKKPNDSEVGSRAAKVKRVEFIQPHANSPDSTGT